MNKLYIYATTLLWVALSSFVSAQDFVDGCVAAPTPIGMCTFEGTSCCGDVTGNCYDLDGDNISDVLLADDAGRAVIATVNEYGALFPFTSPVVITSTSSTFASDGVDNRPFYYYFETSSGKLGYFTNTGDPNDGLSNAGSIPLTDSLYLRSFDDCPYNLPTLTCPATRNIFLEDGDETKTLTFSDLADDSSELYDNDQVTISPATISCDDTAPVEVSLSVTDVADNEATRRSCTVMVTPVGGAAPELTVVNDDVQETGPNTFSLTLPLGVNGDTTITTSDLFLATVCAGQETSVFAERTGLTNELTSGGVNKSVQVPVVTTVTFTCDDTAIPGNEVVVDLLAINEFSEAETNATLTVTVTDQTPPTVMANDTILLLDADGRATLSVADYAYAVSDNCSATVTDIFRFEEGQQPSVFLGADAGAKLDRNAKLDQTLSFTCDDVGNVNLRVEVVAQDMAGNETRDTITVTVMDDIAPTISNCRPVAPTVFVDGDCRFTGSPGFFFVEENCPGGLRIVENYFDEMGMLTQSLIFNEFTGSRMIGAFRNLPIGRDSVELILIDAANNRDTCNFTITVADNTPPTINVTPADVTLDANGMASLTVDQLAVATDNCAIDTVIAERTDFGCDDIGLVVVRVTATDVNGNSSEAFTPVDVDFTQPNLSCISRINVTLDENCEFTLAPALVLSGEKVCLDAFAFEIRVNDSNPDNGAQIDECGTFRYEIVSVGTGALDLDFDKCWGFVNAEDKIAPTVVGDSLQIPAQFCNELEAVDLNNPDYNLSGDDFCYDLVRQASGAFAISGMSTKLEDALDASVDAFGAAFTTRPDVLIDFTDGCSNTIEVCVRDVVRESACDTSYLTRIFTATERSQCAPAAGSGELKPSVVAQYEVIFVRPTLADLSDNSSTDVYIDDCGGVPANGVFPAPEDDQYPTIVLGSDIVSLVAPGVCGIGVVYTDGPAIQKCANTYKFIRTYTVIDWCADVSMGETRDTSFTQVVTVGDRTAPTVVGTPADFTIGTNTGNTCEAVFNVNRVDFTDDCPTGIEIKRVSIFEGAGADVADAALATFTLSGNTAMGSPLLAAGQYTLVYTAEDVCGNEATPVTIVATIEDQTAPVAICEDQLNVSLNGSNQDGFAVLTTDNIDAGSYDDCGPFTLAIARDVDNDGDITDETYRQSIRVDCDDIGTPVKVGLQVVDGADRDNYCWLDVIVEDKRAPTCENIPDVTITCIEYRELFPNDLTQADVPALQVRFGMFAGFDNCTLNPVETVETDGINSCGEGSFVRSFEVSDGVGSKTCTQTITVTPVHDYQVILPVDVDNVECGIAPDYNDVTAVENGCDLISTTTEIDTLRTLAAGEECFKLRVTYDIVNWCEYGSLGEPYIINRNFNGQRDVKADEIYINVVPNDGVVGDLDNDLAFLSLDSDRDYEPAEGDELLGYFQGSSSFGDAGNDDSDNDDINEPYGTDNSRGFFRYTQFILVYDEEAPTITSERPFVAGNDDCTGDVKIEFTAEDDCTENVPVIVELDPDYNVALGFQADAATYALVNGTVTPDEDIAGDFVFNAQGVPTGTHAIRISASDGCGNFDQLIVPFTIMDGGTVAPICIQRLVVALGSDGDGGGEAAVWASDFVRSVVEDCEGNALDPDKYSIIRAEDAGDEAPASGIRNVDVDCDDVDAEFEVRVYVYTDDESANNFCTAIVATQDPQGFCDGDNTLAGFIRGDRAEAMGGVAVSLTSTGINDEVTTDEDGSFAFRNLTLGADYTVQPTLDAAVNLRNVKSSDLTYMIRAILGTGQFDSPYDYVAADVNRDRDLNIFDVITTSQVILGIITAFDDSNWVFVDGRAVIDMNDPYAEAFPEVYNVNNLTGDLRGVDFVGVELGNPFHQSGRSTLNLELDDRELKAGQTHMIELDGSALAAFQGTLELGAGLELLDARYTGAGGLNLNRAGEGLIAFAVRDAATVALDVRATTAVRLSDAVRLTEEITVVEGVAPNGTGGALRLAFVAAPAPASAPNALYQNVPNPVQGVTLVRFTLAEAGTATLLLRDAAGRIVTERSVDAIAGENQLELTALPTGVLTYTLTAGNFTATRKMVVVR